MWTLKKYLIQTLKLVLISSMFGIIVICVGFVFTKEKMLYEYDITILPSAQQIFANNIKFIGIYLIPIIGPIYYLLNILMIYIFIGLSGSHYGVSFTLIRLIHLPFELFALSIPVIISINYVRSYFYKLDEMKYKTIFLLLIISVVLLLISAIVESFLK